MSIKAAVLFSGGLDSTTLLYHVHEVETLEWNEILAINMFYGQKHDKETLMAAKLTEELGVPFIHLDLTSIFKYDKSCTLLQGNEEVPEGTYAEQGKMPSTYVPFRNGLFLSVATSIALQHGAEKLYYGAHQDDSAAAYPDCSIHFLDMMRGAITEGSGFQLDLEAPFILNKKSDIVRLGIRYNVPFEKTWSCYKGESIPCGICATCVDRAKAFADNGLIEIYETGRRETVLI